MLPLVLAECEAPRHPKTKSRPPASCPGSGSTGLLQDYPYSGPPDPGRRARLISYRFEGRPERLLFATVFRPGPAAAVKRP